MKKLFIVTMVVLLVVIGNIGCAESGSADLSVSLPTVEGQSGKPEFKDKIKYKDFGDSIIVYKVKNKNVGIDDVDALGTQLGLDGDIGYDDDGQYVMASRGEKVAAQLYVWVNSGAMEYDSFVFDDVDPTDEIDPALLASLPSEQEAKGIASAFLTDNGLMPSDGISGIEVSIGGSVELRNSETGEIVMSNPTHWLIQWDREIDGIPVAGSGADLSVRVGPESTIQRVFKCWREIEGSYKELKIKSAQDAYEELINGKGSFYTDLSVKEVIVDQVELVYWMDSVDQEQNYIVPVYQFSGTCLDADGVAIDEQPFQGWCEALK